jgi:hypothetical protein
MRGKARFIAPLLLAGAALLLGPLWWARPERDPGPAAVAPETPPATIAERPAAVSDGPEEEPLADTAALEAEVLNDPRVKAYLQREADRETLQAYFDNPDDNPAQAGAIWDLIETLESEQRVVGFEALHLKIAWLSVNSPDQEAFQQRAENLLAQYREQAERRRAAHDPRKIPGFERYKAMERDIIAEVSAMQHFPDGHSRQSYLRQRLQQARVEAYGSGGG